MASATGSQTKLLECHTPCGVRCEGQLWERESLDNHRRLIKGRMSLKILDGSPEMLAGAIMAAAFYPGLLLALGKGPGGSTALPWGLIKPTVTCMLIWKLKGTFNIKSSPWQDIKLDMICISYKILS